MVCTAWGAIIWAAIRKAAMCFCSPTRGGIERHSTYQSRMFVVEYFLHPLHGKQVRVVRCVTRCGCKVVDVEISKGQCKQLPAWMLDASLCSTMSLGPSRVSLTALQELRAILPLDLPDR